MSRELFCDYCEEWRGRKFWSPTQWRWKRAVYKNSSVSFNCCKSCSASYNIDGVPAGCGSCDDARQVLKHSKDRKDYKASWKRLEYMVEQEHMLNHADIVSEDFGWTRYLSEQDTRRLWYWNSVSKEWFFADESVHHGWCQYRLRNGVYEAYCLCHHESGRFFMVFDDQYDALLDRSKCVLYWSVRGADRAWRFSLDTLPQEESGWGRYRSAQDNRLWYWNSVSEEWFYADDSASSGWCQFQFLDCSKWKFWWWHEASRRFFMDTPGV